MIVEPDPITGTVLPAPAKDSFNAIPISIPAVLLTDIVVWIPLHDPITGIFAGYVTIEPPCVNNVACPNVIISFGTTAFSNYVVDFFDEDNQNTTFESNEIIESEADDIIDFSEGNPFGTF